MASSLDRVWEIAEQVGICMLTSRSADGGLRARPLQARPQRKNCICFVTHFRSAKEDEIEADPNVGLTFVDVKANAYVSITGQALVFRDSERAEQLWRATDTMWWEGPKDPNARIIRVEPMFAEMWDGPAMKAVEVFEFFKARLTVKSRLWARIERVLCGSTGVEPIARHLAGMSK
jgi:general stress protein 26